MIPVAAAGGAGDGSDDRIRATHDILLRIGRMRFGLPDACTEKQIRATRDLARLEELLVRVLTATSWQDLSD